MTQAIDIQQLSLKFSDTRGLSSFSLSVEHGQRVLLIGPSGCGKSTILNCVAGFRIPDEGEIRIFGKQMTSHSVWKIRRELVYVGQTPDLGEGTVKELLNHPFTFRANRSLTFSLPDLHDVFDAFRLPKSLLDSDIKKLSGGEKQRVALAGAILLKRKLFLLDEITSALDNDTGLLIADYLRTIKDITVLVTTHNPDGFPGWDRVVKISSQQAGQ